MISAIETELLEITETKKPSKVTQGYLGKLIEKVEAFDNDEWEKLSKAAQIWVNEGVTARDDEKPIPDFPDREDDEAEEAEAEEAETEEAEEAETEEAEEVPNQGRKVVSKKPTKKTAAKKVAAKKVASKKAPAKKVAAKKVVGKKKVKVRTNNGKDVGLKLQIKELILKDFDISADDLATKLAKSGSKPSKFTIAAVRSEFRQTLRLLKSKGHLKGLEI